MVLFCSRLQYLLLDVLQIAYLLLCPFLPRPRSALLSVLSHDNAQIPLKCQMVGFIGVYDRGSSFEFPTAGKISRPGYPLSRLTSSQLWFSSFTVVDRVPPVRCNGDYDAAGPVTRGCISILFASVSSKIAAGHLQ